MKIIIYGEPVAQGRPRFTMRNGYPQAIDPANSREYKEKVKLYAIHAMKQESYTTPEGAILVDIVFHMSIPQSWPKKKRTEAAQGLIRPTSKPDIDNLFKCLTDALKGLAWKDDSQITDVHMKERYTDTMPRTEITITEVK